MPAESPDRASAGITGASLNAATATLSAHSAGRGRYARKCPRASVGLGGNVYGVDNGPRTTSPPSWRVCARQFLGRPPRPEEMLSSLPACT